MIKKVILSSLLVLKISCVHDDFGKTEFVDNHENKTDEGRLLRIDVGPS